MANQTKTYLAVDLGASSGRVVAGHYNGSTLELEAIHRFSTLPVEADGSLKLDFDAFLLEISAGMSKSIARCGPILSVGVSSWGGQCVAIDGGGRLRKMPYYYRDPHYTEMEHEVHRRISPMDLYRITGMYESNIADILAQLVEHPSDLENTDRILLIADYFNYLLSGVKTNEFTNARITQLVDAHTGTWSEEILNAMDFPGRLFGTITNAPELLGNVRRQLLPESAGPVRAVAVGTHDTASAFAAAPLEDNTAAVISLGTWAILGCETAAPVITEATFAAGMQNNAVLAGPVALARNRAGLWLIEECLHHWRSCGRDYTYARLVEMAHNADQFSAVLETHDPVFAAPGEMPSRIRRACRKTGQKEPTEEGQLVRVIFEGLALSFRESLDLIGDAAGRQFARVHVVGGGSRNELLNQFIADACGIPVIAGPHEATSAGNIMAQMMADGELASLEEGRGLIARSWPVKTFTPGDRSPWDEAYKRLHRLRDTG